MYVTAGLKKKSIYEGLLKQGGRQGALSFIKIRKSQEQYPY